MRFGSNVKATPEQLNLRARGRQTNNSTREARAFQRTNVIKRAGATPACSSHDTLPPFMTTKLLAAARHKNDDEETIKRHSPRQTTKQRLPTTEVFSLRCRFKNDKPVVEPRTVFNVSVELHSVKSTLSTTGFDNASANERKKSSKII